VEADVRAVGTELAAARREAVNAPQDVDLGAAVLQRSAQHAQQLLQAT